jgi:hypothetical protein
MSTFLGNSCTGVRNLAQKEKNVQIASAESVCLQRLLGPIHSDDYSQRYRTQLHLNTKLCDICHANGPHSRY